MEIQEPDERLYRHFRAKLEKQIDEFGRDKMKESVTELQRITEDIRKRSFATTPSSTRTYTRNGPFVSAVVSPSKLRKR